MRILHSESSKGWGGQENRTLNELIGMRACGHQMAVVRQPGAGSPERAREAGFNVFEVPMRAHWTLLPSPGCGESSPYFPPTCSNTHSSRDTQLAGMAARLLGRDRPRDCPDPPLGPADHLKIYLQRAARSCRRGEPPCRTLPGVGRCSDRRVLPLFRFGIDLDRYRATPDGGGLRRELGLPENTLLVGTIAILRQKKGMPIWPPSWRFWRGFPLRISSCRRRAAKGQSGGESLNSVWGIGALLGLRRDVVNVLQSLDLFVLPTHRKPLALRSSRHGSHGAAGDWNTWLTGTGSDS